MKEQKKCECAACEKRAQEHIELEEMNFAILLALLPAITITFLSTVGLF